MRGARAITDVLCRQCTFGITYFQTRCMLDRQTTGGRTQPARFVLPHLRQPGAPNALVIFNGRSAAARNANVLAHSSLARNTHHDAMNALSDDVHARQAFKSTME